MGKINSNASLPDNKHSYFMIGLQPNNVRVSIFDGDVKDGKFHQNPFSPATFLGASEDGYILGKASSGEELAITMLGFADGPNDIFPSVFKACNDAKTLVFHVPAGKIIYLGDVHYVPSGRGWVPIYNGNMDSARNWLKAHYPRLADGLETGEYELLPVGGSCVETLYIYY